MAPAKLTQMQSGATENFTLATAKFSHTHFLAEEIMWTRVYGFLVFGGKVDRVIRHSRAPNPESPCTVLVFAFHNLIHWLLILELY
jgi:hypothetical protein